MGSAQVHINNEEGRQESRTSNLVFLALTKLSMN